MKKRFCLLIAAALLLSLLCGCGGSPKTEAMPSNYAKNDSAAIYAADSSSGWAAEAQTAAEPKAPVQTGASLPANVKLIYRANIDMESTEFDTAVQGLTDLVARLGGYFENSELDNYANYRRASYIVRLPAENFETFCGAVGELCKVNSLSRSAEDVSERYYDTESRLVTQQTKLARLQELLRQAEESLHGVLLNYNPRRDNVVMNGPSRILWGEGYVEETLLSKKFVLSADSFFQINPAQTENLYACAGEFLGQCEDLLELYCGVGSIGICLSDRAKRVTGVEIVPQAIEDAKRNAARNGLENIRFFCADAGQAAEKLCAKGEKPDAVLVDPPRKGMDEACINAIVTMNPEKIVYISCNPATQARDCAILAQHGYTIDRLRAFDMFPRTSHVETVVLMSRKDT